MLIRVDALKDIRGVTLSSTLLARSEREFFSLDLDTLLTRPGCMDPSILTAGTGLVEWYYEGATYHAVGVMLPKGLALDDRSELAIQVDLPSSLPCPPFCPEKGSTRRWE